MLANTDIRLVASDEKTLSNPDRLMWLKQLDGWEIKEDGHPYLYKTFSFPNFERALDFVNQASQLAEAENHHPELRLSWGRVEVLWWTHSVNGLHQNDFVMAARTDLLT